MRSMQVRVIGEPSKVEAQVRDALAANGFGVLTEIDVASTLKTKLGIDRSPLKILGACNPELANRALEADPDVALMLPCNVTLESDDNSTVVKVADPRDFLTGSGLADVAESAASGLRARYRGFGRRTRQRQLVVLVDRFSCAESGYRLFSRKDYLDQEKI